MLLTITLRNSSLFTVAVPVIVGVLSEIFVWLTTVGLVGAVKSIKKLLDAVGSVSGLVPTII